MFPYSKQTQFDWNFTSPCDYDAYRYREGNVAALQQGKILGGSGQVNYMLYGKGSPNDYNKWAEITNDCSWKPKKLCKLFKKIENVVDKHVRSSPAILFHGTHGKIKLKKYNDQKHDNYYQSYKELGQKIVLDINPKNSLGYTNGYINIYNNNRRSTAYSYLSAEKNNPNLSVMYNTLATKICFDENKKAVAVEILTQDDRTIIVKAKKEVIISAGVIKSPHLLMLSGIGAKTQLEKYNIDLISNLPQVGQNFQDHPTIIAIYKMGPAEPVLPKNPSEFPVTIMEGYVALNESQGHADYQILSGVVNSPKFFAQVCAFIFTINYTVCDSIAKASEGRQLHFVTNSLLYPESRGEVILKNKDPKQNPIIFPGYYCNENDLIKHAKSLKHYNQVLETKFFKRVNAEFIHPALETCDKIKKDTMEYWKCYVKAMSSSLHMYFGTCAMGKVVNSELQVIGVENLRVADASVIPSSIGSTIQATVMLIAEKLVQILKKHHKLTMQ